MTLTQRLDKARADCESALSRGELARANDFLEAAGVTGAALQHVLEPVARAAKPTPELLELKQQFGDDAVSALERTLIIKCALLAVDHVEEQPVDESVKHLFGKEFSGFANPSPAVLPTYDMAKFPFTARVRLVLFRRFPAGQSQWEISGFPRRWFLRIGRHQQLTALAFFVTKMRGLHPYFVPHLTVTQSSFPMLTERDHYRGFYRLCRAAELQPHIKGTMAASWLHSRETHRVTPHLAFLNRLYMEVGGMYLDLGPAAETDGFLAGDPTRAELYRAGKYKPTFGAVFCSRDQMIAWLRNNQSLAAQVNVR